MKIEAIHLFKTPPASVLLLTQRKLKKVLQPQIGKLSITKAQLEEIKYKIT
jgi:hypothetical protein